MEGNKPVVSFMVHGEPVAQGRPRLTTIAGRPHAYDPPKSRDYKDLVRLIAQQNKPSCILNGPVRLQVDVYRPIPTSLSKTKAKLAEAGVLRPTGKPDISNYIKLVEDACNGVIWTDDARVVQLIAGKFYSKEPRIEVKIWQLEETY